jgi:hypothetical protein
MKSTAHQILLPIVAVVALAGLGTGIAAIASAPQTTTLQQQVKTLQAHAKTASVQSADARAQIATLQSSLSHSATQDNVTTLQTSVGRLQNQIVTMLICIPQLQQEMGGLSVQTANNSGWLTEAYLQNPTIISQNCSKMLSGSSQGTE